VAVEFVIWHCGINYKLGDRGKYLGSGEVPGRKLEEGTGGWKT